VAADGVGYDKNKIGPWVLRLVVVKCLCKSGGISRASDLVLPSVEVDRTVDLPVSLRMCNTWVLW